MRILIPIFLLVQFTAFTQTVNKKDLFSNWALRKGWFGDNELFLEKLDTTKLEGVSFVFKFHSDHTITIYVNIPKGVGACGNGAFYLDKGTWELNNNKITFDLKGGHVLQDEFHYKMIYTIVTFSGDKLVMKKEKTIFSEVK